MRMGLCLNIWGKYDERTDTIHPAIYHCIDTGCIMGELLRRLPEFERTALESNLNLCWDEILKVMPFLMALHDIGKFTPMFASQVASAKTTLTADGFTFPTILVDSENKGKIRHEVFTLYLLSKFLFPEFAAKQDISAILGGHHGMYSAIPLGNFNYFRKQSGCNDPLWHQQQQLAYDGISKVFPISLEMLDKIKINPDSYFYLSGLISNADWIASDSINYPFFQKTVPLEEYLQMSKKLAFEAMERISVPLAVPNGASFKGIFNFEPYQTQKLVLDQIEAIKSPCLTIIEDLTGNGKTETALYASTILMRNLKHRGIHFLMPTQATANGIMARFIRFLEHSMLGVSNFHLGHSMASLHKDYIQLRNKEEDSGAVALEWFASGRKKFLAQFGDSTVDQAMFGALVSKYFFMRLYGMSNKVVVIDEVHSYDAYMIQIIDRLIRELKKLHCSIILLSATLPRDVRARFLTAYGCDDDVSIPYPRVTIAEVTGRPKILSLPTVRDRKIKLNHLYCGDSGEARHIAQVTNQSGLLNEIINKSQKNCVAVICNTVGQSQRLYNALRQRGADCILIHSRYQAYRRAALEQQVLSEFGKKSIENRKIGKIVIGTQLLEQSLDIDFDYMFSFIAPVDLLIQRLGRLHRFSKIPRTGEPTATIIYQFKSKIKNEKGKLKTIHSLINDVYSPYLMERSWGIISKLKRLDVPEMIENVIEQVYNPVQTDLSKKERRLLNERIADINELDSEAQKYTLPLTSEYLVHPHKSNDFPRLDEAAKTRLITPTINTLILFQGSDHGVYMDCDRTQVYKGDTKWVRQNIGTIIEHMCPVVGDPLFGHLLNAREASPIYQVWKREKLLLRFYSVLVLDRSNRCTLRGNSNKGQFVATVSYNNELGLRSVIKYL